MVNSQWAMARSPVNGECRLVKENVLFKPSFLHAKERVNQRSEVRVSQGANALALMQLRQLLTRSLLRSTALSPTSRKEGY
jgi:hypothetical protein